VCVCVCGVCVCVCVCVCRIRRRGNDTQLHYKVGRDEARRIVPLPKGTAVFTGDWKPSLTLATAQNPVRQQR